MSQRELFIVEGVSAASTVRQAMHKPSQAVLATRGKMINADKHPIERVRKNLACKDIIDVLECGFAEDCQVDHLAFSAVVLLTDPDMDGTHARALLVQLFAKYFHPLVTAGKIYVVVPPMFRMTWSAPARVEFASSQQECRDRISATQNTKADVTRLKGIAQFSLEQCATLLLNAKSRYRVQLTDNVEDKS